MTSTLVVSPRPSLGHGAALTGAEFKANHFDVDSGDHVWISGPRKDGADRLYGERVPVEIDDDVCRDYWTEIRGHPARREIIANR